MERAGSELEPPYGHDGGGDGMVVSSSSNEGPVAGSEAEGQNASVNVGNGRDRMPEQEAADLLEQAAGLEPDYDFHSAEGGPGSPQLDMGHDTRAGSERSLETS